MRGSTVAVRRTMQRMHLAGADAVPARLRFAHHGKGAVFVNGKGFKRVGDKKDVHGYALVEGYADLFQLRINNAIVRYSRAVVNIRLRFLLRWIPACAGMTFFRLCSS